MREKNKLFDELLELSAKANEITLTDDMQKLFGADLVIGVNFSESTSE